MSNLSKWFARMEKPEAHKLFCDSSDACLFCDDSFACFMACIIMEKYFNAELDEECSCVYCCRTRHFRFLREAKKWVDGGLLPTVKP